MGYWNSVWQDVHRAGAQRSDPQTVISPIGRKVMSTRRFNSYLYGTPVFPEVWEELTPLFQDVEFIVAHNASFDKLVLYKSCDKYNIPHPEHNFTCSIKAAKHCWKLPSYKLNTVCDNLGIELDHHEALSDSTACAEIMIGAYKNGYRI